VRLYKLSDPTNPRDVTPVSYSTSGRRWTAGPVSLDPDTEYILEAQLQKDGADPPDMGVPYLTKYYFSTIL